MPGQVTTVTRLDLAQAKFGGDVERTGAVRVEILTYQNLPLVVETDQALVEGKIEVGCEQQAVERIEPLGRAGGAPGFDMRGAQQLRYAAIGHRTATPVGQQIIAITTLTNAGLDQGVTLGVGYCLVLRVTVIQQGRVGMAGLLSRGI